MSKETQQETETPEVDDNKIDNIQETEEKPTEEIEELKYQSGLEEKVLEYVQLAQRLQADFDNYRKHATEQIADAKYNGQIDAITEFIPVLDSFKSAKSMIKDEKLLEGFNMIENQILNAFTKLGVEKINTEGQLFDPQQHNALAIQSIPDLEDGAIITEYQAGYKINDKIIRYSQVIVNKKEE